MLQDSQHFKMTKLRQDALQPDWSWMDDKKSAIQIPPDHIMSLPKESRINFKKSESG